MAPRFLLDTNVLREIARPTPHANVAKWLSTVDDAYLAISVLSVQELWKGVESAKKKGKDVDGKLRSQVEGLVAAFEGRILNLDATAAKQWGQQLGKQDKHLIDKGIASIALANGCVLVTRNVADMKGLGVDVLDPFKSPALLHAAS